MAQDELAALEPTSRLAVFHQHQGLQQAVEEHKRRAGDAVTQDAFDTSA